MTGKGRCRFPPLWGMSMASMQGLRIGRRRRRLLIALAGLACGMASAAVLRPVLATPIEAGA